MSQMIPLKIADMAVAACNEEIAKHLLEIGRLQGRVIALEGQLAGEKAIAKALRSLSFTTAVPSEDYEKLKADLAKSEEHNAALCERLQDLNGEVHTASCINARLHMQFANSEQKVARLIKAGTAMGMALPDTDEANAAYRAFEYAAKGGQS
jgi:predicted  nucleic acid-binding Zn-ribbon protein